MTREGRKNERLKEEKREKWMEGRRQVGEAREELKRKKKRRKVKEGIVVERKREGRGSSRRKGRSGEDI